MSDFNETEVIRGTKYVQLEGSTEMVPANSPRGKEQSEINKAKVLAKQDEVKETQRKKKEDEKKELEAKMAVIQEQLKTLEPEKKRLASRAKKVSEE